MGTADTWDLEEEHYIVESRIADIDEYMLNRFGTETDGWGIDVLQEFVKNPHPKDVALR
ncbi:hypothetical protein [Labilibacter marinus]|uniref:hypothetical protein n=1 Tax=Labilibacter marinus TaxID=1477105 RepID=UPI001E4CBE61|nr:hypothetical protein [Labilibacter marinus]